MVQEVAYTHILYSGVDVVDIYIRYNLRMASIGVSKEIDIYTG